MVKQLAIEQINFVPPTDGRQYIQLTPLVPLAPTYFALTQYTANNAIGTLAGLPAGTRINVAGHSLGGHLAQAFQRLFPQMVDTAYAFNTTGFYPTNADRFFQMLNPLDTGFDNSKIKNIYSYTGPEFITAEMFHTQYGQRIGVLIEDQPIPENNHSGVAQARSLALHALFERIAPNFDLGVLNGPPAFPKIDALIQAEASNHPTTYEATLRSLVKLFLGEEATVAELENLETFYQKLYGVYDKRGVVADD